MIIGKSNMYICTKRNQKLNPSMFSIFKSWFKENDKKLLFGWKEKPDYQIFRAFLRAYIEMNPSSPRAY